LGEQVALEMYTGPAEKNLFAMSPGLIVLDPAAPPQLAVYSVNYSHLRMKLFAVEPSSWSTFRSYMSEQYHREAFPPDPPGRLVVSEIVKIKNEPDELVETAIDLSKAFAQNGGVSGNVIVLVEPPERPKNRWEWTPVIAWVQATRIGLDAFVDNSEMVAFATDLATGKPLSNVELTLAPGNITASTGADGLATIALPDADTARMLVARHGGDSAFLPRDTGWWGGEHGWQRAGHSEAITWYVADDRQMYRPGEEVKIKGWLRTVVFSEGGDVKGLANAAGRTVTYAVRDSTGNEILKGETTLNPLAGFDASFTLPKTVNLGHVSVFFTFDGHGYAHSLRVEEFRRPEFEVTATSDGGPHFVGGHATASVTANYYAGGALANAETNWTVKAAPGSFTPPNQSDYQFGPQRSWWWSETTGDDGSAKANPQQRTFQSRTSSTGKHVLAIDFLAVSPPQPTTVQAWASVMDVNRQAWSTNASLLVHPADLYVGLKTGRPFVRSGEPIEVEAIVSDLDGKLIGGRPIAIKMVRLEWKRVSAQGHGRRSSARYSSVETDPQECKIVSATAGPVKCTFKAKEGGLHRATATIADDRGRFNASQVLVWVPGGRVPQARGVGKDEIRLVPNKTEYGPGEIAEIALIPPWYPAEGVLTLRRSGIVKTERISLTGPSHIAKVKIEESWTPNMHVQVDLVGTAERTDDAKLPRRPALASGSVNLSIPPVSRRLALEVKPRDSAVEPGGETAIELKLRDAAGNPVAGGEVAVVVVDEAVLALTGYHLPDPLERFYPQRGSGVNDHHLRELLQLASTAEVARDAPQGGARGRAMRNSGTVLGAFGEAKMDYLAEGNEMKTELALA
ncbi:MAG: MG2 domain-containing protein, partial [Pseudomonadota bacterium]